MSSGTLFVARCFIVLVEGGMGGGGGGGRETGGRGAGHIACSCVNC